MLKLYEIAQEYMQLCEIVEDTDVDEQVFEDTLAGIEAELEEKADAYAVILANLDNDTEKIDKEIERLTKMKKILKSRSDFLKRNLTNTMLLMNKKKFKTDIHSYSISKNAPSLNILDEAKIPEKYMIAQEPKLDRKALLSDVKANPEEFNGIAETKQTESLRIR
ncbi:MULTISPECIES: siphovirus Gp157 family protein [unclassified Bacillota]|jgi:hypothetical protein|nr:hypothetical protein DW128_16775 [Firmicutes bacterium AM10-47]RHV46880.1 hypothetical protein DXB47_04760 [Firmicutes bacterium OM04-13BH]DAZ44647.1 MAG TPA: resistance protein [Caudoviricetes sp.]